MYDTHDKKRLYLLIDLYISHKISARDFCDEYHETYDLETDLNTLTPQETKLFSDLSIIAGRFADIEEDLKHYPGVYFSEKDLSKKILEVKELLGVSHSDTE